MSRLSSTVNKRQLARNCLYWRAGEVMYTENPLGAHRTGLGRWPNLCRSTGSPYTVRESNGSNYLVRGSTSSPIKHCITLVLTDLQYL